MPAERLNGRVPPRRDDVDIGALCYARIRGGGGGSGEPAYLLQIYRPIRAWALIPASFNHLASRLAVVERIPRSGDGSGVRLVAIGPVWRALMDLLISCIRFDADPTTLNLQGRQPIYRSGSAQARLKDTLTGDALRYSP